MTIYQDAEAANERLRDRSHIHLRKIRTAIVLLNALESSPLVGIPCTWLTSITDPLRWRVMRLMVQGPVIGAFSS